MHDFIVIFIIIYKFLVSQIYYYCLKMIWDIESKVCL